MSESKSCPQCGAQLAADAPDAPCPACLMKIGMANWAGQSGEQVAQTEVQPPKFDAPSVEEIGALFPQFEIKKMLGFGGMGAVYLARQKSLDRDVALKIIKPATAEDRSFAERFAREARALARLSHQNIVTVHDFGEVDGLYYFVMEYVDGVNLRQAMRENRIEPLQALAIVPKVCDALQYAHEEGVVHRDIKPENILLDKRGRVKIADFGLAKLLRRAPVEMTLTSANQVMGTMHYMAPEQLERPLDVDHRADIYSLGVVLYELMTGDLPIGRFELPSERELDARLDNIVLRTLERKPEKRYQQISDLKTDVEHLSSKEQAQFAAAPVVAPVNVGGVGNSPASSTPASSTPSSSSKSVPFRIHHDGIDGAKGLVRFNGDNLSFDFTIGEYVEWSDSFEGFKPGVGKATLPLSEIATATYNSTWSGGKVGIQANSLDAVAKIPGHDRGRVDLTIEKRDRELALGMVNAVRRATGDPEIASEPVPNDSDLVGHTGLLLMGIGFVVVGAFMLYLGVTRGDQGYLWTGIGVALGGGAIMGSAFSEGNRMVRGTQSNGNWLMGLVMFSVGVGLMLLVTFGAVAGHKATPLVWVGMGIALGGCGVTSSAWASAESSEVDASRLPSAGAGAGGADPPGKPSDWTAHARAKLRAPAGFISTFAVLNMLLAIGVSGLLIFLLFPEDNASVQPIVWPLVGAAPVFLSGLLMWIGASNMRSLKSRSWALTGAVISMLPVSVFFPFSFCFGVWAASQLGRPEFKKAFEEANRNVQYRPSR